MWWIVGSVGLVFGFVFTLLFPIPYFFIAIPRTVVRTMRGLLGRTIAWSRDEFVSFNALDLAPRCWYRKIARDQASRGWLGFGWDDGLGIPLRSRFFNNWLTYWPLHRLGAPYCLGLGYLLTSAVVVALFGLQGNPVWGIFAALAVLASPLFVASQVFYGKPETCWWFPAALLLYFILNKSWLASGLTWSFVSLVNLPAGVVLGFMSLLGFLIFDGKLASLGLFAIGCLPGALVSGGRLWMAWEDGFTRRVGRALRDSTQAKGSHLPPVLLLSAAYLLLPLMLFVRGQNWGHVIFTSVPLVLYWVIFFVYYFNDPAPVVALMFACEAAYVAIWEDAHLIFAGLLFAFASPLAFPYTLAEFREDVPQGARGLRGILNRYLNFPWLKSTWRKYGDFPRFTSVLLGDTKPLLELFDSLPEYSRVVLETDPRGSKALGYRGLVNFLDCYLALRHIEIIPDEYLLQFWGDTTRQLQDLFRGEGYSPRSLEVAKDLGAGYALVFSQRLLQRLKEDGCEVIADRRCEDGCDAWRAVTDHLRLYLVRLPFHASVVDPQPEQMRMEGNRLIWQACEGSTYRIRYAYHPNFSARNLALGESAQIRPYSSPNLVGVQFMELNAPAAGEMELRFRKTFF